MNQPGEQWRYNTGVGATVRLSAQSLASSLSRWIRCSRLAILQAAGERPLFTHLFTDPHNYMDGAGQNSTIWTVARTTYPQVRIVLAAHTPHWLRGARPTFNPAGQGSRPWRPTV
jgi:hypothetical protein